MPTLDPATVLDRRAMRFHGGGSAWNQVAMEQAIARLGAEPGIHRLRWVAVEEV